MIVFELATKYFPTRLKVLLQEYELRGLDVNDYEKGLSDDYLIKRTNGVFSLAVEKHRLMNINNFDFFKRKKEKQELFLKGGYEFWDVFNILNNRQLEKLTEAQYDIDFSELYSWVDKRERESSVSVGNCDNKGKLKKIVDKRKSYFASNGFEDVYKIRVG